MTKKVVVRVAARGYVDGRYIGEEKEVIEAVDPSGRGKRGRGKPAGRGGTRKSGAQANDDRGNRISRGAGGPGGTSSTGGKGSTRSARGGVSASARGGRRRTGGGASAGASDAVNQRFSAGGPNGQNNQGNRSNRGSSVNSDADSRGNGVASATPLAREPRGDKNRRGGRGGRGARPERAQGGRADSNVEAIVVRADSSGVTDGNVMPGDEQPRQNRQPRAPRVLLEQRQPRQPRGPRGESQPRGERTSRGQRQGIGGAGNAGTSGAGGARGSRNSRGGRNVGTQASRVGAGIIFGGEDFVNNAAPFSVPHGAKPNARRNRGGKKTPFRVSANNAVDHANVAPGHGNRALISEVAETMRWGADAKSGQFAEALAKEEVVKRERLHKVLAQSGHGSRRDMEIMITSGRVMVNGIVATTGTSISASDAVMIDKRLVKLKFDEALPRLLLYHKPDGEIVTTSDPGNRITVFDNLPRVENGKWMSIGRLDINTSGLLIFTTSGELANRLMHPRYEIEREYAVRILGELTEAQTERLLAGITIESLARPTKLSNHGADNAAQIDDADIDVDEDEAYDADFTDDEVDISLSANIQSETNSATNATELAKNRPAKFDSIEARGGEGVNHWYHVVLREGRNREVRKMFEAVGLTVSRLMRVRFGKIGLPPRLTRGRMMELDDSQVRAVLRWVGMEVDGHIGALPSHVQAKQPAQPAPPRQPNRGQGQPQKQGAGTPRVRPTLGDDVTGDPSEKGEGNQPTADSLQQKAARTLEGERSDRADQGGRGSRNGRGARGGAGRSQRQPRATGEGLPTLAVEGEDFVAGETVLRDYARAIETNDGQDAPANAAETVTSRRQPRRGPGRNLRRPRDAGGVTNEIANEVTNEIGNANAGAEPSAMAAVASATAQYQNGGNDGVNDNVGNPANATAAAKKASRVKRESPDPHAPRAARKPRAARLTPELGNVEAPKAPARNEYEDDDAGNR